MLTFLSEIWFLEDVRDFNFTEINKIELTVKTFIFHFYTLICNVFEETVFTIYACKTTFICTLTIKIMKTVFENKKMNVTERKNPETYTKRKLVKSN